METAAPIHSHAADAGPRATRGSWLVLAAALLAFGAYFSHAAPAGHWKNQVFGTELWLENDPGGSYVPSAHELFLSDQGPLFPGHPGTTLQLLLCALQHGYHWIADDEGYSFTAFTARHVHQVFFLSKMLVSVLHVLGVFSVHRLARLLLQREDAAVAAALAYATCFPFLYFFSRISVEPLMVLFFVTAFLSLSACHRRMEAGDSSGALASGALAGALAVSGSFSKLNLLGPLPFFGLLYLLTRGGIGPAARVPLARRLPSCGAFALAALLGALLYSQLVDWGDFRGLWRDNSGLRRLDQDWTLAAFLPWPDADGVFLLGELAFLALAGAGWVTLLRAPSPARPDFAWLSLYSCWVLMLWAYRVATLGNLRPFHYLLPVMALAAVSFGHVTHRLLARASWSTRGRWLALLAWVGLVHLGAIWSATDSRVRDAAQYRPLREVHAALAGLRPGQGIALLDGSAPTARRLRNLHGLSDIHAQGGRESRLEAEFLGLFASAAPADVDGGAQRGSSPLGPFAVIDLGTQRARQR